MRIFALLVFIISFGHIAGAKIMDEAFNKREAYLNQTTLGNPHDASKILGLEGDISNLESLSDSSLLEGGSNSLRNSAEGRLLQEAEEKKIDAIERYKINSENSWIKNTLRIEEDPLSETGGRDLSSSIVETTIEVKKQCTEGVGFNVDVGLELIVNVREDEYLGPLVEESRKIRFPGNVLHNEKMNWGYALKWKDKRWGWHIHSYHPPGPWGLTSESPWKDNPLAIISDARAYIAHHIDVPIEAIGENVTFPSSGRGIGKIGPVGHRWRVVWDEYEFGYDYRFQEKLKKLVEEGEYWQVVTEGTEKIADANECYETNRVCLKSGTKVFLDKYEITRPCWYEKISYRCQSQLKKGCDHLIKQDCRLVDSECEYRVGSICLRWKRDFICGGKKSEKKFSLKDSSIYCLGGDCHTPVIEENEDLANVGYLAAVGEAHKDCDKEANGMCKDPITVFPGESNSCRKIVTGFINCCESMKGWGHNLKLNRCNGAEKGLALKKDRGNCHRIGTYCSKRDPVFGKCLVKKTSHCCFNSKLARIFHQQGRAQLGISWGSASSPNCRSFTLEELSRIDFSKFDYEELFDDMLNKGKSNVNKSFPVLKEGEIPPAQIEHMKTNTHEKREIRRRSKLEQSTVVSRVEEVESQAEIQLSISKQNIQLQVSQKEKELAIAKIKESEATAYWNKTGSRAYPYNSTGYLTEWRKVQKWTDKQTQLKEEIKNLNTELVRIK